MLPKYKKSILYKLKPSTLYVNVTELFLYVPQVNTKWLASKYCDRLGNNPTQPSASMKKILESKIVLKLLRTMVYKASARAMSMIT